MSKEKLAEFEAVAKPLIKWLNDNHHPHTTIIITPDRAEIMEVILAFPTTDYIRD